jgi:hypothetical protein
MFFMTDASNDLLEKTRAAALRKVREAIGGTKNEPRPGSPGHFKFLALVEARAQTALLAEAVQWTRRRP